MTTTLEVADQDTHQEAVERIDAHLASLPPERDLITVSEHVDILLDLRLLFMAEASPN